VVLASILFELLAQQLQGLYLVIISDVDEFVLEVAQVQVGALFHDGLEAWITLVEEATGHPSHCLAHGRRAHHQLLSHVFLVSVAQVLLHNFAKFALVPCVQEGV